MFIVHNRGGVATTLETSGLAVACTWLPKPLIDWLGPLGWVPVAESPHLIKHRIDGAGDVAAVISAGGECEVRITLWDQHREALAAGRLILVVVHTWSRRRPQQLRVIALK